MEMTGNDEIIGTELQEITGTTMSGPKIWDFSELVLVSFSIRQTATRKYIETGISDPGFDGPSIVKLRLKGIPIIHGLFATALNQSPQLFLSIPCVYIYIYKHMYM